MDPVQNLVHWQNLLGSFKLYFLFCVMHFGSRGSASLHTVHKYGVDAIAYQNDAAKAF